MGGSLIFKHNFILIFVLIIAVASTAIVHGDSINFYPDTLYHSKDMVKDANHILYGYAEKYPSFITVEKAAETYLSNEIVSIRIGKGERSVFINASHHGKEHMTTLLAMNQIDYLVNKYQYDKELQELLNDVSIVFLPMVNPDGIQISRGHVKPSANIISVSGSNGRDRHMGWKANGRGVDINRNYPMRWDYIKDNPGKPAIKNYKGEKPFSEIETKVVEELCQKYVFELVISYHSAGEVIFWYAYQDAAAEKRDLAIAREIGSITGYKVDMSRNTAGGMKDWFVQQYGRPGFTIEIGNPGYVGDYAQLPYSEYKKIWMNNRDIPEYLLRLVKSQSTNLSIHREEDDNVITEQKI